MVLFSLGGDGGGVGGGGRGGRGTRPDFSEDVPPKPYKLDPISDPKIQFSQSYFRSNVRNRYPISVF